VSVWESEEWLKEHVKPLAQSGGAAFSSPPSSLTYGCDALGIKGRLASQEQGNDVDSQTDNTMEE